MKLLELFTKHELQVNKKIDNVLFSGKQTMYCFLQNNSYFGNIKYHIMITTICGFSLEISSQLVLRYSSEKRMVNKTKKCHPFNTT